MSARQIPNLLTLRGGPVRSRGSRGSERGRDHSRTNSPATTSEQKKDLVIQETDTDAAVSRLSAASLGYLIDPYAAFFVEGLGTRTYTRTVALDLLLDAFLAHDDSTLPRQVKQIISLGAGTDTRYFRLREKNMHTHVIYHEFDYPSVSAKKQRTILNNSIFLKLPEDEYVWPTLQSIINPTISPDEWGFCRRRENSDDETIYCFHPVDLRELARAGSTHDFRGFRTDIPTLIISECCLCYLQVNESRNIVMWFANKIPSLGIILYEPIGINDSFGKMMVANLAARDIVMPSVESFQTLASQETRLLELGFLDMQRADTIERIWEKWIAATEKHRVDALEGLDEVEEWQMLARHYAVAWGWRGDGWESWKVGKIDRPLWPI